MGKNKPKINKVFEASPKQEQFINAVLSGKYSFLVFGGAIRGGKTFVALAIAIILCKLFPGSRWAIVRQSTKRLKDNTRPSLDKFISGNEGIKINEQAQTFTFPNKSVILFKGENFDRDKTLESFKGLEVNGFIMEEVSETRYKTYLKCMERAGSYVIQPTPPAGQPPPLIIATCNPTQTWIKQIVYDPWKAGTLPKHIYYLPSFVTDNPFLDQAYLDNLEKLPLYEYEVFVKGNWDITLKTQNAFWHQLEVKAHIAAAFYDQHKTIHVSIDSNVLPFCSATIWQVDTDKKIVTQVGEIAAKDPNNHASGLARKVREYLEELEYSDVVFLYGDATTKSQNTIDEKRRSFLQIFIEELQETYNTVDHIGRSNPQVAKTGEFVNALYAGFDGWRLLIGEGCKESLSDYLSVKKDMDGTMQKRRVTDENGNSYEEYGHMSDTKRYFLYKALDSVYHLWDNRFSEPTEIINIEFEGDNLF